MSAPLGRRLLGRLFKEVPSVVSFLRILNQGRRFGPLTQLAVERATEGLEEGLEVCKEMHEFLKKAKWPSSPDTVSAYMVRGVRVLEVLWDIKGRNYTELEEKWLDLLPKAQKVVKDWRDLQGASRFDVSLGCSAGSFSRHRRI